MKVRQALLCGATIMLATSGADAAVINLIDRGGVAGSAAERGFEIAARYWESVLTNDVEINIRVGFQELPRGVIGRTSNEPVAYSAADWKRQVGLTKSNSLLDRTAILPTLNDDGGITFITSGIDPDGNDDTATRALVLGDTVSSRMLFMNTAVLKAIGAIDRAGSAFDGSVIFSNQLPFDFDPSDGVDPDAFDFIGTAIHEFAHALGFVSGVDYLDIYGYPFGPESGTLGYSVNDTALYSSLDMFRYGNDPTDLVPGTEPILDLSAVTESYFSIDGGKTALYDNSFSTGRYNGDGDQASHWRDAHGTTYEERCTIELGIMNPTACLGQADELTALDLAAFDAMGWNLSFDVLENPGYLATTASIYRQFMPAVPEPSAWAMMLTGFAMVGGALRRRRSRVDMKVSFAG